MTDNPISVFDVESQLAADDSGKVLRETTESLTEEASAVKRHIDRGVPADEFTALSRYREALSAATNVVEKIWKREHAS